MSLRGGALRQAQHKLRDDEAISSLAELSLEWEIASSQRTLLAMT